jgi:hypothetical protein
MLISISMLIVVTFTLSSNCCCISSSQTLYLGDALSTDLAVLALVRELAEVNCSSLIGWKRTRLPTQLVLRDRRDGGGGILFRPLCRAAGAATVSTRRFSLSVSLQRREQTLPAVGLVSITHRGQLSKSDFHSPVRGDRRESCTKAWQGHLPSSSMGVVVMVGSFDDVMRSVKKGTLFCFAGVQYVVQHRGKD